MKLPKYVALKFSGATMLITYIVSSLTKHRNGPWDRLEACLGLLRITFFRNWPSLPLLVICSVMCARLFCITFFYLENRQTHNQSHQRSQNREGKPGEMKTNEKTIQTNKNNWEWQRESCCHWVVPSIARAGYRIREAQWKLKIQNHLFRNY